jgi:transglutaminase-like putative cysteine protease
MSKRDRTIPRRPLLWLSAALLFTLPPMFSSLRVWVPCLFLLALVLKLWMEPRGYHLRLAALKLVLVALALGAVLASYGSLNGIEPGISILVMLMSLKILEAHTAREFHVTVMMAWLLCLCGLLLSQDLAFALCLMVAFTLLIAALVEFHRGPLPGVLWPPLSAACKLLAQAAPLIVALFLFFPRVNTGFWSVIRDARSAASGFSDRLAPGSIARLANASEIAFRAEFTDGKTQLAGPLYWRGVVMWQCQGMEWRAPGAPAPIRDFSRQQFARDKAIRQRITIAPHGGRWMFALDRPFEVPRGTMLARGNYLLSIQPIRKARRYEVVSSLEATGKQLSERERQEALQLPARISPAAREVAQSWAAQSSNPHAVVTSALQFFRTRGFRYSLSPGEYGRNALDEFLFHRRTGFCEHYAASFATLMRLAGIPSRVVVGYLGGEYNDLGKFFLVRQADTHAWCEVWLPGSGWTRVDPTSVVAPGRASLDLSSFLASGRVPGAAVARGNALVSRLARLAVVNRIRLLWEALNYEWDTRLLGFDADVQKAFLESLGLSTGKPLQLLAGVLATAVALLACYFGWTQWRTRPHVDRVKTLYERFCQKLTRAGVERAPWEGPWDFARRAAALLPNNSDRIKQISEAYIALRYAPAPTDASLKKFAQDVKAFLR